MISALIYTFAKTFLISGAFIVAASIFGIFIKRRNSYYKNEIY